MDGSKVTGAIGLLGALATLVTAVPAVIQLFIDRPYVYFDVSELSIINPNSPDLSRVRKVLQDNNVSDSIIAVHMKNRGQGPAKEVRLGVSVTGEIRDPIEFVPTPNERPVWVDLPEATPIGLDGKTIRADLRNFAREQTLKATVRYHSAQSTQPAKVQVYFDGKPAQQVVNVEIAPAQTALSKFVLPLKIFVVSVIVMLAALVWIGFKELKKVLPYPFASLYGPDI
jgi:hypothetical protein